MGMSDPLVGQGRSPRREARYDEALTETPQGDEVIASCPSALESLSRGAPVRWRRPGAEATRGSSGVVTHPCERNFHRLGRVESGTLNFEIALRDASFETRTGERCEH